MSLANIIYGKCLLKTSVTAPSATCNEGGLPWLDYWLWCTAGNVHFAFLLMKTNSALKWRKCQSDHHRAGN
ncbi:hypothetical protein KIN20_024328 [Parelaphostrongylus tenuis]|uniref:Uncharacterized protein n=1 Tax=Parelaphostrongylus tenuis TaxID=148309 RepID=A0AAD5QVW2_PARTN|nr:hypothetical protein KIN20_024328 [Parelaphostrongylus tenuis]